MKIIIICFIVLAGLMVIGSWALAIVLAIKSGKGLLSFFRRPQHLQWLSSSQTAAIYGLGDDDDLPPA